MSSGCFVIGLLLSLGSRSKLPKNIDVYLRSIDVHSASRPICVTEMFGFMCDNLFGDMLNKNKQKYLRIT